MRTLTDHIVDTDQAHQIKIFVADEPGAGGANHCYQFSGIDEDKNPSNGYAARPRILFQNGPIAEADVNGVTHEALLTVIIDRLRSFQAGPYSCRENAIALTHCEDALMWLQKRTRARIACGVEGTHEK